MANASGALAQLNYVTEADWGVTPETPSMKKVRLTSESLAGAIEQIQSQEIRGDRMIAAVARGAVDVRGAFNYEFSYGAFDDYIAAALFGSWDTTSKTVTGNTLSFADSTKTIADSGSGLGDFEAGDVIKVSGSTSNDGYYTVATAGTGSLVVEESLVDESASATITIKCEFITAGTTVKAFTMEKWFSDISKGVVFTGCMVDTWNLEIRPNQMVTGSFAMSGKDQSFTTSALGTPTAAASYDPFEGSQNTIMIREGGSVIALVSSVSLSLSNNLGSVYALGSNSKADIPEGRSNLTGTISALFQDLDLLNKWLNKTPSSLDVRLPDPDGNQIRIYLPNIEFGGSTPQIPGEETIMLDMPFQALLGTTLGSQILISR
ncbi:MAG: hypothetical protein HY788_08540 [Deltaproteobacteria bacterium]|nr:hypothetical protein [Deltaproteobacteria bacterium]